MSPAGYTLLRLTLCTEPAEGLPGPAQPLCLSSGLLQPKPVTCQLEPETGLRHVEQKKGLWANLGASLHKNRLPIPQSLDFPGGGKGTRTPDL
jgi:hypothetical protein